MEKHKQEIADYFLHNTSFPMFVLNFIILCQAVPEKFPYSLYRSDRWKNYKVEKNGKTITSHLIFSYTIHLDTV